VKVEESKSLRRLYRVSAAPNPPLRVGVILDGWTLARWTAEILQDIIQSNFARIELLIFNNMAVQEIAAVPTGESRVQALTRILRTPSLRKKLLYSLYDRKDAARIPADLFPFEPVDCREMLQGVEQLSVDPLFKTYVYRVKPEDCERVRSHHLDVILRFGFNVLRGDILQTARYGVWSFHHGDNTNIRGGPACYWEMRERHPYTGAMLQILDDSIDAGKVLCKGRFGTEYGVSFNQNRIAPYWGSNHFVIQKLWDIHQHGWEWVKERILPPEPYQGRKKMYKLPTNLEMATWIGRDVVPRIITKPFRKSQYYSHWESAIRRSEQPLYDEESPQLDKFQWIEPPKGHAHGDPILFGHNGKTWLFIEDYPYEAGRAHIACAEVLPDGKVESFQKVLACPYHLSFPIIFEHQSEVWMIPESHQNETVDLYRARKFPYEWVHEKTLFEGRIVDTNVWHDGERWWFFPTFIEKRGLGVALLLFSADSLTGEWKYHPANPISQDAQVARGAGPIFRTGERLIRPSQNGTPVYGRSLVFNEIERLNPLEYKERMFRRIDPWRPGQDGVHTYSRVGPWETVDGARLLPVE
jgi:hypothetical protein